MQYAILQSSEGTGGDLLKKNFLIFLNSKINCIFAKLNIKYCTDVNNRYAHDNKKDRAHALYRRPF